MNLDDPKKKRFFIKHFFAKDKTLYDVWKKFYDAAVKEFAAIPENIAWIKFRELYIELPDGTWRKIETKR